MLLRSAALGRSAGLRARQLNTLCRSVRSCRGSCSCRHKTPIINIFAQCEI